MSNIENDLFGKKVVILGLARQGLAMARFAVNAGAKVVVSDKRSAPELQDAISEISDLQVEIVVGEHPNSLLEGASVLVVSGGVPTDIPIIAAARKQGVLVTNDSQEFIKRAPCKVIGITGSAGKTTTTALTGNMIAKSGRNTWVGGNIGHPLLQELPRIGSDDLVVQELSSFQLELWTNSPPIASVLNITPNHLDRHHDFQHYRDAKANILRYQSADDIAVLSEDDLGAIELASEVKGRMRSFSQKLCVDDGTFVDDNEIVLRDGSVETVICSLDEIALRGRHNIYNVLAAAVMADSVGVPADAVRESILEFRGMPHRLELVATVNDTQYVNDSIATAPERALAALDSYSEPVILLAGGRDKDMVWDLWARRVHERVKAVILFGELAELLETMLSQYSLKTASEKTQTIRVKSLGQAVTAAAEIAAPGDVVLLAPGGTSFDSYVDFEARGKAFRKYVLDLAGKPNTPLNSSNGSG